MYLLSVNKHICCMYHVKSSYYFMQYKQVMWLTVAVTHRFIVYTLTNEYCINLNSTMSIYNDENKPDKSELV